MTRGWDEAAAAVFDIVPGGLLLFLLICAAIVTGVLWYWYPRWIPRRLPRIRLRLPKRTKRSKSPFIAKKVDEDPTIPIPTDRHLADRLADEGRYADAIRQRLRDVVSDLAAAGVVHPQPGTTAAELAALTAARHPGVAAPLSGATELFSEIWYGARPADRTHDERMRGLTGEVRERLRSDR